MNRALRFVLVLGLAVTVLGAVQGCRSTYYSIWESLGKEKRDLLRANVESVQKEQEEAAEHFESALDRLRQMVTIDNKDLERTYDRLKKDYERAESNADDICDRIDKIKEVAGDLFREWEQELGEISSPSLRGKSRDKLAETRRDFSALASSLQRAEKSMQPVLTQLKDHVLYLKHNLNAAAIAGLDAEVAGIESDVDTLLADMRRSINEADAFLQHLQ